jgi:hypothetical protein
MKELLYKEEVFKLVGLCMEIHSELGKGHDEKLSSSTLVIGKGDAVAERRWRLASYEVAGIAPNHCLCLEGTPEFRRPVGTVSFLQQAPGTLCRANFRSRSATRHREQKGGWRAKKARMLPSK